MGWISQVTWDSWMYRYLHLDFVVYVADMVTDTLCLLLYVCEYNWFFAMLQLLILGVSIMKQLNKMAQQGEQGQQAQNLLEAFLTSRQPWSPACASPPRHKRSEHDQRKNNLRISWGRHKARDVPIVCSLERQTLTGERSCLTREQSSASSISTSFIQT